MKVRIKSNIQIALVLVYAVFLLSGCGATSVQPPLTAGTGQVCISEGWPHDRSDLSPDPALQFEVLDNGLRYVIMKNNEPEDRVGLYLNIQAGSLHENDDQRGYAHFLEHMLFNGTIHYPPGTLIEYFQSIGMSFGADTNAHTTFDETVYKILLPTGDAGSLENGLQVMADYARGALLLEDEVARERGIILAEKRARDSVGYRLYEKRMRFSFAGTRVPERFPIGTEEALAKADSSMLRDFYDAWYRPENMILIVVGDVDDELARQVIARQFNKLSAPVMQPRCFAYGKVDERGTTALYVREPEKGSTEVSLSTRWNTDPAIDSIERRTDQVLRYAASSLLNNRLEIIVSRESSPLTRAQAYSGTFLERFGYASITATTDGEQWSDAISLLNVTLRQALESGFTERELNRVRKEILAGLEKDVRLAGSRDSRKLATLIIDKLNRNEVVLSPKQDLELFGPVVDNLSLDEVNRVFRSLWVYDNRQYLVVGTAEIPAKEEPPEAVILAVVEQTDKQVVPAWENGSAVSFPYLDVTGTPGLVAEKESFVDIGVDKVVFQNGTVLNVKQTDFKPNEVMVTVHFGSGKIEEPQPGMGMLADTVIRESGFGKLNKGELKEALAGHSIDFSFRTGRESFSLNTTGLNSELELMLQLIMTQLLDPAFREDAYALSMERFSQMYDQMAGSAEGMMQLEGERFLAGGDVHFGTPPREEFMKIGLEELRAWLVPVFTGSKLEISVTGDVQHNEVISLVAAYLGNLDRPLTPELELPPVIFPKGQRLDVKVVTEIDKAMVVVGWLTDDFWDISRTRRLNILAAVLDDRLRLEVREKLGAVYSPAVYNKSSRVVPGYGVLRVIMTVDPQQAEILVDKVREVAQKLAASGIEEEELKRSIGPTLTSIKDMMRSNRYWLNSVLSLSSRHPEQFEWPLTIQRDFSAITVEDINDFAARYLTGETAAEIILRPVVK